MAVLMLDERDVFVGRDMRVRGLRDREPRALPKVRRRKCRDCKGVRLERWDIRTDTVLVDLISIEVDARGRKFRHEYCRSCLRLAGKDDEIDRRVNATTEVEDEDD